MLGELRVLGQGYVGLPVAVRAAEAVQLVIQAGVVGADLHAADPHAAPDRYVLDAKAWLPAAPNVERL